MRSCNGWLVGPWGRQAEACVRAYPPGSRPASAKPACGESKSTHSKVTNPSLSPGPPQLRTGRRRTRRPCRPIRPPSRRGRICSRFTLAPSRQSHRSRQASRHRAMSCNPNRHRLLSLPPPQNHCRRKLPPLAMRRSRCLRKLTLLAPHRSLGRTPFQHPPMRNPRLLRLSRKPPLPSRS